MLLNGLLCSTQCVWCFVDGARAHGTGLKTMKGVLSSFLEFEMNSFFTRGQASAIFFGRKELGAPGFEPGTNQL